MLIRSILPKLILLPALQTEQISFLTAFLFAILPVNIEPVTWIAASKVTLYTLFYLAALLSYCRYLDTARAKYFYLTLFFFVLSFATKEQAVLMPLCMLLFDYIYGRDFKDKMIWFEKLPLVILTVLFGLISLQSQGLQGGRSFYPVLQRIPLSAYTLSEYFTKCLIPINLSFLYPFPFQNGDKVLWWLWIYAAAIPLMIYCLYKQLKNRWLLFGLLFFFIHIGLVINLVPLARYSVTADRYAYLSTIGTCFIVGYFVVINLHTSRKRLSWLFVFGLYTALLTAYSSSHIRVWTNTYTLKEKLKKTIESRKDYEELKKLK